MSSKLKCLPGKFNVTLYNCYFSVPSLFHYCKKRKLRSLFGRAFYFIILFFKKEFLNFKSVTSNVTLYIHICTYKYTYLQILKHMLGLGEGTVVKLLSMWIQPTEFLFMKLGMAACTYNPSLWWTGISRFLWSPSLAYLTSSGKERDLLSGIM